MGLRLKFIKYIAKEQRGMSLIEMLIALMLLAVAGIAFLSGLTTLFQGVLVSQRSVTMESLAKSELEYVKSLDYVSTEAPWNYQLPSSPPSWDTGRTLPDGCESYTVAVSAVRLDPANDGTATDDGLQQITVSVTREGGRTLTLSGYKVRQE